MKYPLPGPRALQSLVVLVLFGFCLQVQAQSATYNGSIITLPVVLVDSVPFAVELELVNRSPREFRVSKAERLAKGATGNATAGTATFSFGDGMLRIPALLWANTAYTAQLTLQGRNPVLFRVNSVAPLNGAGEEGGNGVTGPVQPDSPRAYAALPDGRGGTNFEPVVVNTALGFDKERSLAAFKETLYPYLRRNVCVGCHNSDIPSSTGAQAPLHADGNPELAHEYALTRVNFADPEKSRFVVRMGVDRHNCPRKDCATAAADMLAAILAWKSRIADTLPATPRTVPASVVVTEAEVGAWIAQDKAALLPADRDYIVYTSLHELHNEGLSAAELNIVRVGLSKALNSVARWAPAVVNPVDVNGKGLLYKFDIRDYWGWNKGVTRLLFGGSDDDLAFGRNKRDYRGTVVTSSVQRERYNYTSTPAWNPEFALAIWERVLHGNVEGAVTVGTIPPYISGFRGKRSSNAAGQYIARADFEWVETAQLIYTLTRPDVYNAIMMIPMTSVELEDELGVDKSQGMDSYDYVVSYDAITIDSRLLWRARRKDGGWYWKTWDIFTGQLARSDTDIHEIYREAGSDIRFPWWANPVPVFVDPQVNRRDTTTWSFVASLAQPFVASPSQLPAGCDPVQNFSRIEGFYNCRHFTGTGGLQQSASEIIWDLPNGLQGYMLTGAFNQRRVDAFVNIVRDPRLIPNAADNIATQTGFAFNKIASDGRQTLGGFNDPRLNVGSSCIGCHIDGMNRLNNDLRDWLDEKSPRLPSGPYGVDRWINDSAAVARVKELYPPSDVIRGYIEDGRRTFLGAMAEIKQGMIIGPDKNVYVEPVIWAVEYVQRQKYKYPQTTSN